MITGSLWKSGDPAKSGFHRVGRAKAWMEYIQGRMAGNGKRDNSFQRFALMVIREMKWSLKGHLWFSGYWAFKMGEITAYLYADEPG